MLSNGLYYDDYHYQGICMQSLNEGVNIDLEALLQQAKAAKDRGFDVVSLDTDLATALVARLGKAEAELTGFKQIVSAEVLRCQPGDVVLVDIDACHLSGSPEEFDAYCQALRIALPVGLRVITKVPSIDIRLLTDEQLASAGLAKLSDLQAMDARATEYLALTESQALRIAELEREARKWKLNGLALAASLGETSTHASIPEGWRSSMETAWEVMLAAAPKPEGGAE